MVLASRGQREAEAGGTAPVTDAKERLLLAAAGRRILMATVGAAVIGAALGWLRATYGA